jgi:ribosomal protein S18 acetylase RimI-like enzyme
MTDEEARAFAGDQDEEYARQKVNAGDWPADDALRRARAEHELLHDGSWRAKGHDLLVATDAASGARVGWVWVGPSPVPSSIPSSPSPTSYSPSSLSPAPLAPSPSPTRGERFLFQFTIDAERRGQGYGRAMLDALVARLRAEGWGSVLLNVFRWNEAAIALYEGAGFVREKDFGSSMHMRKRLA